MKLDPYHYSLAKRLLDKVTALSGLILLSPILLIIWAVQKFLYPDLPALFIQKRTGKNGRTFNMFKFRTMIVNAHRLQKKYNYLNISDGPAFKIYNDPRLTRFGRILFKTGLDELPQLINVLKGEMSIVGPRPLPVAEANKLTDTQLHRQLVRPGITSSWVVSGGHQLSFKKWMMLDLEYVKVSSVKKDLVIIAKTIMLGAKTVLGSFI